MIVYTTIIQIQCEIKNKGNIRFTTSASVIFFFHGLSSIISIFVMVG